MSAVCEACGRRMDGAGCTLERYVFAEQRRVMSRPRIRCGQEKNEAWRMQIRESGLPPFTVSVLGGGMEAVYQDLGRPTGPLPRGDADRLVDAYMAARNADPEYRCRDCGVKTGDLHHPGCDMEECPRCGMQALACDCPREGDD